MPVITLDSSFVDRWRSRWEGKRWSKREAYLDWIFERVNGPVVSAEQRLAERWGWEAGEVTRFVDALEGREASLEGVGGVLDASPDPLSYLEGSLSRGELDLLAVGVPHPSQAATHRAILDGSAPPELIPVRVFPTVERPGRKGSKGTFWILTQGFVEELQVCFPAAKVSQAARQALMWVRSNTERTKTAKGMPAFMTTWMGEEQRRADLRDARSGSFGGGTPAPKTAYGALRKHGANDEWKPEIWRASGGDK